MAGKAGNTARYRDALRCAIVIRGGGSFVVVVVAAWDGLVSAGLPPHHTTPALRGRMQD